MRIDIKCGGFLCATFASVVSPELLAQGFIDDAHADLLFRNYYFNDNYHGGANDRREWGQAFLLNAGTGYTDGVVGFGLDALGLSAVRLDSSPQHAGTGLLPVLSDGHAASGFSSFGLGIKVRFYDTVIKYGTNMMKIPVLVPNDGRLLPQTLQGAQVEYKGFAGMTLHAGQMDRFKFRDSTDSVAFYPNGYSGSKGSEFDFAGATYAFSKQLSATYYYGEMTDFYRQQFVGLVHKLPLGPVSLNSDLRYFTSGEAGAAWSGPVDSDMFSGLWTFNYGGHSLGYGYQKVMGDTALPYISGGSVYSFTNAGVGKFVQGRERTRMWRYDYDFAAIGTPGLRFMIRGYDGGNGLSKGKMANEREVDTSVEYVVQDGTFKGLGIEVHQDRYRSSFATDRDDSRLYLTYELKLW